MKKAPHIREYVGKPLFIRTREIGEMDTKWNDDVPFVTMDLIVCHADGGTEVVTDLWVFNKAILRQVIPRFEQGVKTMVGEVTQMRNYRAYRGAPPLLSLLPIHHPEAVSVTATELDCDEVMDALIFTAQWNKMLESDADSTIEATEQRLRETWEPVRPEQTHAV